MQAAIPEQHLYIRAYDQVPILGDYRQHRWEAIDHPRVQELRERYDLLSVAGDGSEWQQIRRLLSWVHHRATHGEWLKAEHRDAHSLLEHAAKGGSMRCTEYSHLLAQVLCAVGFPARVVALRRENPERRTGSGHMVTEVWVNSFRKWVLLDGQCNAYWTYQGIPQNMLGLRALKLAGQMWQVRWVVQPDAQRVDYGARFTGFIRWWMRLTFPLRLKAFWAQYFYHGLFHCAGDYYGRGEATFPPAWHYFADGQWPTLEFQGLNAEAVEATGDAAQVNFTCNATAIQLHSPEPGQPFAPYYLVELQHCTPWFAGFEVRFDGAAWERVEGRRLTWVLKPGVNRLEARTVNVGGRRGMVAGITLEWDGRLGQVRQEESAAD